MYTVGVAGPVEVQQFLFLKPRKEQWVEDLFDWEDRNDASKTYDSGIDMRKIAMIEVRFETAVPIYERLRPGLTAHQHGAKSMQNKRQE